MGLFRKKSDPISERAKTLNQEIAALQAEIQRLSEAAPDPAIPPKLQENSRDNTTPQVLAPEPIAPPLVPASPQPRLRSTAFPQKHQPPQAAPVPTPNPFSQPVFEDVGQNSVDQPPDPAPVDQYNEIGVRKYDLASLWRRWTNHFRGPATSNPKLVNYLAAGSIQGLRPLRYERRVARNRFIVLVVVLIAVLWGLVAVLMKRG
jgi:hypothetical protein